MTTRTLIAIAGLSLALASFGCEEKKAETTKAADTAMATANQAKQATAKALETTKEAVKEGAAKAVAAVTEDAKAAMKGYIDSLGESTGILSKVKGPTDAAQFKPLGESLAKNAGYAAALDKLSPDVKGSMKSDYGSALDGAMKAFTEQKDRIMKDPSLSKLFGDALGKFKSFSL